MSARITSALILLLLPGCFLVKSSSPTLPPSAYQLSAEDQAAYDAEMEEHARALAQVEIDEYLAKVDAALQAFEAEPGADTFESYSDAIFDDSDQLSERAYEDLDVELAPHAEVILNGTVAAYLSTLEAQWKKKKKRTSELNLAIRDVYLARFHIRESRHVPLAERFDDAAAFLAHRQFDSWDVHSGLWAGDSLLVGKIDNALGHEQTQQLCRMALDRIVAEEPKNFARIDYVLKLCVEDVDDWEGDLAMWTSAKETKSFRESYPKLLAENAAINAEFQAQRAAEQAAERAARNAAGSGSSASSSSGSSASGSSGSSNSGPTSISLRNTCGSSVNVFYGDNPEFGSGRSSSMGGNSRMNGGFYNPGDMIWLTDANKKPIASATVSASTSEIVFTCSSVSAR